MGPALFWLVPDGATTSLGHPPERSIEGATIDPTKLPIGDSKVSLAGPSIGGLWACRAGNPNAGGARANGPWLNIEARTWDSTKKLAVKGSVIWDAATYSETLRAKRVITTKNLPVKNPTGVFPIAADDPSYQYDRNPGIITATAATVSLPERGTEAAAASCMNEGPVGVI